MRHEIGENRFSISSKRLVINYRNYCIVVSSSPSRGVSVLGNPDLSSGPSRLSPLTSRLPPAILVPVT